MTSTTGAARSSPPADLGTLVVLAWSGEAPGGDMPYLLAYTLGDAQAGPEAASTALRNMLENSSLPVGGDLVDGNGRPDLPVSMLIQDGQAVVTMPGFNARCTPPQEWLTAVDARGYAYFVFTTRPWPEALPGEPLTPEALAAFVGSDETLNSAAHIVLPSRGPRG